MPIYDYRCEHCGHVFSAVQSFAEAPLEICPNCGKRPRRLLATPAIVFKGSGWYKTDSRSAPKSADAAKSADASPADAAKSPDASKGAAKPKGDATKSASSEARKGEAAS